MWNTHYACMRGFKWDARIYAFSIIYLSIDMWRVCNTCAPSLYVKQTHANKIANKKCVRLYGEMYKCVRLSVQINSRQWKRCNYWVSVQSENRNHFYNLSIKTTTKTTLQVMNRTLLSLSGDSIVFVGFLAITTIYPLWNDISGRKGKHTKATYIFATGRVSMVPMMFSIARGTLSVRSLLGKR